MRRREFMAGLGSAVALAARAQQPDRMRHVGVLMNVVQEDPGGPADVMAFRHGLAELGWIEGRNIHIEFRWPGGDIDRVQTFAKELVGLRPDVLIGRSTPTTAALKQETTAIPIIFVTAWGQCYGFHQFRGVDRGQMAATSQGGRSADRAGRCDL